MNNLQALIYHGWNEWLAGILIIVYFREVSPFTAAWEYLMGFIAFISIYETGYLINDFWSVKHENNPRMRAEGITPSGNQELLAWITFRLVFFGGVILLTDIATMNYVVFSLLMLVVFGLHNFIREKEVKFLTFISLSLFRFILPLFPFVRPDDLRLIIPGVLINYCLYRTVNYLDSKDMLVLKNKKEAWFKLSFYLLLLPLSVLFTIQYESPFPLLMNCYFLTFWLVYFVKSTR
jgi:hypothetical protein